MLEFSNLHETRAENSPRGSGEVGFLPDKRDKTADPGVGRGISLVREARQQIADNQTVMLAVNTVAANYPVSIVGRVG